jgi:DNA mismatch repair protein MutL
MAVYGREVAESMVEVSAGAAAEGSGDFPDGPLAGVSGFVSHPETNRASREYVGTYVNGRYVTASTVRDAVVEAYGTQLAPDRYPFAVLFLDVPAGDVDVNVHPRKLDVRFAEEEGVREQVRSAVEDALLDAGLLRSGAPRGKSAPDQTEISPEPDSPDTAAEQRTDAESAGGAAGTAPVAERSVDGERDAVDSTSDAGTAARPHGSDDEGDASGANAGGASGRRFSGGHDQARLGGESDRAGTGGEASAGPDAAAESFDSLPSMRVLGQFQGTYVVAETDEGLVLMDQHAADERVNYERLRERFAGDVTTQALADPVTVSLTVRETELFEGYADALATLGFRAERTGDRTVEVRTVPSLVAEAADPDMLRDVLGAFVRGEGAAAETVEAAADELLADLACYPSVTGNTSLTEGTVRELLAALDDCENPWACPHGRPVIVEFDTDEVEARFERDYPGHGGRRE